jgi:hypothetical protein
MEPTCITLQRVLEAYGPISLASESEARAAERPARFGPPDLARRCRYRASPGPVRASAESSFAACTRHSAFPLLAGLFRLGGWLPTTSRECRRISKERAIASRERATWSTNSRKLNGSGNLRIPGIWTVPYGAQCDVRSQLRDHSRRPKPASNSVKLPISACWSSRATKPPSRRLRCCRQVRSRPEHRSPLRTGHPQSGPKD